MRALLVEDGAYGGTLAGARALHAAGWQVGIGSPHRTDFARFSRAATRWHRVPNALLDHEGFLDALAEAGRAHGYDVVFPGGDTELLTLSLARERVPAAVPYAEHHAVVRALDKLTLNRTAHEVGLAVPAMCDATPDHIASIGSGEVVVKSRLHFFPGRDRLTRFRASAVCRGADEARRRVEQVRSDGAEPVIEERVAGRLMALVVVSDRDGEILAAVQQQAERMWPAEAGITARGATVAEDPALRAGVQRLLRALGWFGLAELQFIQPADGPPKLLDLNGRFYGSLALAVRAGVNLPALWAALATGRPVPDVGPPRVGTTYQWFEADLKRGVLGGGRGAAELVDAIRYARTAAHGVWSVRDPAPAAAYSAQIAGRGVRRLLERWRR